MGVTSGVSATAALQGVPLELRPGVQALLFHVLRHLGCAQALRRLLAPKSPPPEAGALLSVALACCGKQGEALYDAHTLVNQVVEAAKRSARLRRHSAFFNGCLRRYLREQSEWDAQIQRMESAAWNYPDWWIDQVRQDYPEDWQGILRAGNLQPLMTLRVNVQHHTPRQYQEKLAKQGIKSTLNGSYGLTLNQALPVHNIPGFTEGMVSVQDAAAQMAAPLLLEACRAMGCQGDLNVLDACAAPGGKTAHLLELGGARVTALEIDATRAARIQDNLNRVRVSARTVVGDASEPDTWFEGEPFDAILLDAPCTASGIVRRHPDIRWLRREADLDHMALIQKKLFNRLWSLLKPGGCLLYCTCSIFKTEGEDQVQAFLAHHTDARLLKSPGHLLPLALNSESVHPENAVIDHDGFYFALLHKLVG